MGFSGMLVGADEESLMRPSTFNWVTPRWTITGLTITMLGMGMTLTLDDLRGALKIPKELLSGFVLQYSVMPLSAFQNEWHFGANPVIRERYMKKKPPPGWGKKP